MNEQKKDSSSEPDRQPELAIPDGGSFLWQPPPPWRGITGVVVRAAEHIAQSPDVDQLIPALIKAIGAVENPGLDKINTVARGVGVPYSSLAAVRKAILPALTENGLAITQDATVMDLDGARPYVLVVTTVWHTSAQWRASSIIIPISRPDPQGCGISITYGRRYALLSLMGIVGDDDTDGADSRVKDVPEVGDAVRKAIQSLEAAEDIDALQAAFRAIPKDVRSHPHCVASKNARKAILSRGQNGN